MEPKQASGRTKERGFTVNPLSPFTYYRRHKGSALLLLALITLATLALYLMVSVLDSIPTRAHFHYLTRLSRVYPASGSAIDSGVVSQIQTHPAVARVVPDNGLSISPPSLIGTDSLRLLGVSQDDAQYLVDHYGVRLKEGRMFEPRTNEIVLSEEVARALGLQIGDRVGRAIHERYYGNVPAPMVLVGILEGDPATGSGPSIRVGLASYEYLDNHELYAPRASGLLVIAREGHKATVDEFLETTIRSTRTEVETYGEISELVEMGLRGLHLIFGVVNCVVAVVVALVVGVVNRIALTRRMAEFGLLHAVGYRRKRLIDRLTLETTAVAGAGWIAGLVLSWFVLAWLKAGLYYSKGMELDLTNAAPLWFTLPLPIVVVGFAVLSTRRTFARFDAISIIERGKLGMEAPSGQRADKRSRARRSRARRSSTRPLSSRTFYLRHRRRGVLLVASMALMILGVAFPAFLVSVVIGAFEPSFEYLRYVSRVSSATGHAVDPGVMARIRSHPAVARVIPAMPLGLTALVPPGSGTGVSVYGVAEDELPVLVDLFGMRLVEGRLPRVRSNEIVVSEAVARNRGLRVGDTVGRSVRDEGNVDPLISDDIPVEMVVVGLLSADDLWLGFASFEYLESHELTSLRPVHLLVIPAEGRKDEFDAWLGESVASVQTDVDTFVAARLEARQAEKSMLLLFAAVESIIAVVAAIALAVLNHIFFSQRRDEFGILHAVGHSRPWLVLRTVRETGSVVAVAWLIGAAMCATGLVWAQAGIYAPRGLSLDFTNPAPWLFTFPIPLAVVAVGAGTIARALSKLDPVAVIERR
jgi:ABC-type lipoprotein release transport system permease subunit